MSLKGGSRGRKTRSSRCKNVDEGLQNKDTLEWMSSNYEQAPGVCLPRCTLYQHYLDNCRRNHWNPVGAAAFGKLIRLRFPKVTTRRLGTRGQSRYHYYGIGVKTTSIYYGQAYCGKNITRFSGQKIKRTEHNVERKSWMQRGRRHGWNFWPEPQDLRIPEYIDKDKLDSFLAMYRAHCCSLLDAVVAANFEAVRDLVLHFWTSISESTLAIVSLDVVLDVVTVWDSYLYGVMEEILMPKEIQDIPESYEREINFLVEGLPDWICRVTLPGSVRRRRIQVLQEWTKVLRRQLSFTKLAQSCRSVLSNADHTHCILDDLNGLDLDDVAKEAFCCLDDSRATFDIGVAELISLLKKHASVEDLTEWLDMAMDNAALDVCITSESEQSRSHVYKDFMLSWMLFFSAIMRHLTLSGSPSFGHIHLVRVMAEEYMLLAFETSVARDARLRRQEAVLSLALRPEELRIKMASAWAALSCSSNRE